MWIIRLRISAAFFATTAVTALLALAPNPEPLVAAAEAKSKSAVSAEMTKTETKLTQLRELVKPQPGEYVTNIAKIDWQRDPWEAAVKAAKEGKPVIAYGPGMVGVPCGYG